MEGLKWQDEFGFYPIGENVKGSFSSPTKKQKKKNTEQKKSQRYLESQPPQIFP